MKKENNTRGYQPQKMIIEGYQPTVKPSSTQPPNKGSNVHISSQLTVKKNK